MTDLKDSKPNKYNHSKLYKLQCDTGHYYIGCTTDSLPKRLGGHKRSSKIEINRNVYSHINSIGWDKVRIVLISEHYLENREQLLREEDRLIKENKDDPFCLNAFRAILTDEEKKNIKIENGKAHYKNNKEQLSEKNKEYRENNKEQLSKYYKEYRENNKDKIKEKQKEYSENNKDKIVEYRKNNKDVIREQRKEYRENNKNIIKEKKKQFYEKNKDKKMEKIECICGSIVRIDSVKRHERTKKHINYLSQVASSNSEPIDNINMVSQDAVSCTSESQESCL